MKGYNGKILHINLTEQKFEIERPNEDFYRKYVGGSCMGVYYVMQGTEQGVDPLSPDNVIAFTVGPLTGSNISGASRHSVTAKSPLTGGIATSEGGGYFAPEMKKAGFDAIVLTGKAETPSYLWICDGEYSLLDAAEIWGKTTGEAQAHIRNYHEDQKIRVAQIGCAGETLCRYANIVNELAHFNGRGGLGAVMGSKNLRAIAVRGTQKPDFFDPEGMKIFARKGINRIRESVGLQSFKQNGTIGCVVENSALGGLPTRNWTSGTFENVDKLMPEAWNEEIIKPGTCYACAQSCKRHVDKSKTDRIDAKYGGPEYETIGMCGSNLGISDKLAICKINEICAMYAMDTVSFGATMGFIMECFEKGIITAEDTEGFDCHFGNSESVIRLAEMTGTGTGFGKLIALGSERLSGIFGNNSSKLLITVKKKEFPAHMPQTKAVLGLSYALVSFGSDHVSVEMDPSLGTYPLSNRLKSFGFDRIEAPDELNSEKAKLFWRTQRAYALVDTASVCIMIFGFGGAYSFDELVDAINFATGWETNLYEMLMVGERGLQMMRAFNIREGFDKDDDKLPLKLSTPLADGISEGKVVNEADFNETREQYYEMAGWVGEKGEPSKTRLMSLNLDWVGEYISQQ